MGDTINLLNNDLTDTLYFDGTGGYPWWWSGSVYSYSFSNDTKINYTDKELNIEVLVAGVNKEDVEAYVKKNLLTVEMKEISWNGSKKIDIDLSVYEIDVNKHKVSIVNGVLRLSFPRKDEKLKLKIG